MWCSFARSENGMRVIRECGIAGCVIPARIVCSVLVVLRLPADACWACQAPRAVEVSDWPDGSGSPLVWILIRFKSCRGELSGVLCA